MANILETIGKKKRLNRSKGREFKTEICKWGANKHSVNEKKSEAKNFIDVLSSRLNAAENSELEKRF